MLTDELVRQIWITYENAKRLHGREIRKSSIEGADKLILPFLPLTHTHTHSSTQEGAPKRLLIHVVIVVSVKTLLFNHQSDNYKSSTWTETPFKLVPFRPDTLSVGTCLLYTLQQNTQQGLWTEHENYNREVYTLQIATMWWMNELELDTDTRKGQTHTHTHTRDSNIEIVILPFA